MCHDLGNFLVGNFISQQLHFMHFRLGGQVELFLQLGDNAVLQLRHAPEITGPPSGVEIQATDVRVNVAGGSTGQAHTCKAPPCWRAIRAGTVSTRSELSTMPIAGANWLTIMATWRVMPRAASAGSALRAAAIRAENASSVAPSR